MKYIFQRFRKLNSDNSWVLFIYESNDAIDFELSGFCDALV